MKKLLFSLVLVCGCLFSFEVALANQEVKSDATKELTNVQKSKSSSNFMDIRSYTEIYKMSEDAGISMPFIKAFNKSATYDKLISSSGLSIAQERLNIEKEMKGVQTIISGDTVNITGNLEYANIIANNVVIDGNISKDVFIMSQSLFLTENAKIGGDLVCVSVDSEIKGQIDGNIILTGDRAVFTNTKINKDFRVKVKNLIMDTNTNINGKIYIETNTALNILDKYPTAVIKKYEEKTTVKPLVNIKNIITKGLILALSYMALYYIIKTINKNGVTKYSNKVKKHPTFTILAGFVSLFIMPISMFIMLAFCSYGIGLVLGALLIVYLAMFIAVLMLSTFITGTIVFEMISPKLLKEDKQLINKSKWLEALLLFATFIIMYILTKTPYISEYAISLYIIVALGSTVTNIFKKEKTIVEIKAEK